MCTARNCRVPVYSSRAGGAMKSGRLRGASRGCSDRCRVPAARGWRSSVRPHNAPRNGKLAARARSPPPAARAAAASPSLVWVPPTSLQTNSTVHRTSVSVTFIILLLVLPRARVCVFYSTNTRARATWRIRVGVRLGKVPMRALILRFGMRGRAATPPNRRGRTAARSTGPVFYFYNI